MRLELDVQYSPDGTGFALGDLPSAEAIESWVRAALEGRRAAAQLVVRIVDERESAELNQCYRARKGPTNVLSFPFGQAELLDPPLLGDVVVCAPLVKREAAEQGKAIEAHWAHLVVHGVLHLIGYDHEGEVDAEAMEAVERELLATLGYPDPYDDDASGRIVGGAAPGAGPRATKPAQARTEA